MKEGANDDDFDGSVFEISDDGDTWTELTDSFDDINLIPDT